MAGIVGLSARTGDPELNIAAQVLPIRNCEATYLENDGLPIPLSKAQQDKYIDIIGRGLIPDLDGGVVVGSHRLSAQE